MIVIYFLFSYLYMYCCIN